MGISKFVLLSVLLTSTGLFARPLDDEKAEELLNDDEAFDVSPKTTADLLKEAAQLSSEIKELLRFLGEKSWITVNDKRILQYELRVLSDTVVGFWAEELDYRKAGDTRPTEYTEKYFKQVEDLLAKHALSQSNFNKHFYASVERFRSVLDELSSRGDLTDAGEKSLNNLSTWASSIKIKVTYLDNKRIKFEGIGVSEVLALPCPGDEKPGKPSSWLGHITGFTKKEPIHFKYRAIYTHDRKVDNDFTGQTVCDVLSWKNDETVFDSCVPGRRYYGSRRYIVSFSFSARDSDDEREEKFWTKDPVSFLLSSKEFFLY